MLSRSFFNNANNISRTHAARMFFSRSLAPQVEVAKHFRVAQKLASQQVDPTPTSPTKFYENPMQHVRSNCSSL